MPERRRSAPRWAPEGGTDPKVTPHRPHHRTVDDDNLSGGIARHREPIEDRIRRGGAFGSLLTPGTRVSGAPAPFSRRHIEARRFRVTADGARSGQPTPEGAHRDGVTFVLMALAGRDDVVGGETTGHDLGKQPLASFPPRSRVSRSSSTANASSTASAPPCRTTRPAGRPPSHPGHRDVLAITYRHKARSPPPHNSQGAGPVAEIIAVAVITVLAVISPGADFAVTVRNSYLHGRAAGLLTAVGISLGVLVHVAYTMLGVGLLLSGTPALFTVVKIVGACYLVWIGYRTFSARAEEIDTATGDADAEPRASRLQSLRTGFLTTALNPKTVLFVVSTYSQVVHRDTPLAQQAGYGFFMAFAHLVRFGLAAGLFSAPALRSRVLRRRKALDRSVGAVLMALGVSLVFASA